MPARSGVVSHIIAAVSKIHLYKGARRTIISGVMLQSLH